MLPTICRCCGCEFLDRASLNPNICVECALEAMGEAKSDALEISSLDLQTDTPLNLPWQNDLGEDLAEAFPRDEFTPLRVATAQPGENYHSEELFVAFARAGSASRPTRP